MTSFLDLFHSPSMRSSLILHLRFVPSKSQQPNRFDSSIDTGYLFSKNRGTNALDGDRNSPLFRNSLPKSTSVFNNNSKIYLESGFSLLDIEVTTLD